MVIDWKAVRINTIHFCKNGDTLAVCIDFGIFSKYVGIQQTMKR
jgi:hypothetical protein